MRRYVSYILMFCLCGCAAIREMQNEPVAVRVYPTEGEVRITVLDAYLGEIIKDVYLTGVTDRPAEVFVDQERVEQQGNNVFKAEVYWREGSPIVITATDEYGNRGELNYYPDGEEPEKPENLRVNFLSASTIGLEWDADDEDEEDILGYEVYYRVDGKSFYEEPELVKGLKYELLISRARQFGSSVEFFIRAVDRMYNESRDSDILRVDLP